MTRKQAWATAALLVAVLAVGRVGSIGGASAQVGDVQLDVDPGLGFVFRLTGVCAGVWQNLTTGVCVHADFPGADGGHTDGRETYDSQYKAEIAGGGGKLPGYCAGVASNPSWRVIYAYDRGTASRYPELQARLKDATERIDYWVWKTAKQTGGSRHVRYLCNSNGGIDFGVEDLAGTNTRDFSGITSALRGRGYNNATRKYLVWADVNVKGACGQGEVYADDSAGSSNRNNRGNQYAVVYLRTSGCEKQFALTGMHEIAHAMGAVQASAPNHHKGVNPWHAREERDRLAYGAGVTYPSACSKPAFEKRYDCAANDYFHTKPARGSYLQQHWNVARSQFLRGAEGR